MQISVHLSILDVLAAAFLHISLEPVQREKNLRKVLRAFALDSIGLIDDLP
jgi:hypothetical protein